MSTESNKINIAIQGVAGCFHDQAARQYFADRDVNPVECETFEALVDSVSGTPGMSAMMAIENTIAGPLLRNHELLRQAQGVSIVGEHKMRISHCLAALPGQKIADIAQVNSHSMALMQCDEFLTSPRAPHWRMVEVFDTAGAARQIALEKLEGQAAICSSWAARLYGLEVLAPAIETNKHNFTRFLVISSQTTAPQHFATQSAERPNKASFVFSLPHTQGALSSVLAILSFYGMNLSKIQSLPIVGREWEYRFYIDVTFSDYSRYRAATAAVLPLLGDFKLLGEYTDSPTPSIS